MSTHKEFTSEEAKNIGSKIGINWDSIDLEEFRMGLNKPVFCK